MSDEAKAVSDVANTVREGVKATQQLGGFLSKFVSGPLEEAALYVQESIRFARFARQVRFMKRTNELLEEMPQSRKLQAVPLKIIAPLIEAAALEEDDNLQDRWANLLINAADPDYSENITTSYINILTQLSALEVRVLDLVYSLPFEQIQHDGATTSSLPNSSEVKDQRIEYSPPSEDIQVAIGNLVRLNCLRIGMTWGGGETFDRVLPTMFGKHFVQACTLKMADQKSSVTS